MSLTLHIKRNDTTILNGILFAFVGIYYSVVIYILASTSRVAL